MHNVCLTCAHVYATGVPVKLCKFHRLQAWRRHLQNHPQKDDIMKQCPILN